MSYVRRIPLILSIGAVAIALTACGDSAQSSDTTTLPPTTASVVEEDGAVPTTSAPVQGPSGVSGDLTVAGQSLNLDSGCVNTFDPSGTGRVTAQFFTDDGTTFEFVAFAEGDPTVTIVQDGRIWSAPVDTPFTIEIDAEAGRAGGRGTLVGEDDAQVAVEFSAAWDLADPCP